MNKKRVIRSIFIILAAISACLILLFLTDEYRIKLVSTSYSGPKITIIYADLNHDGNSEKIEYQLYQELKVTVTIYENERIISHNVFDGQWSYSGQYLIGDINQDNIDEFALFTIHNDTLYFQCVNIADAMLTDIPVCRLNKQNGQYSLNIAYAGMYDVNSDSIKEVFFSVMTGFIAQPRALFACYLKERRIVPSQEFCALIYDPVLSDLDNDGSPEIICGTNAYGNCDPGKPFSDQYSWFMVFSTDLKFKFPPVRLDTFPARATAIPFKTGDSDKILLLQKYSGKGDYAGFLALYDPAGLLIRKKEFSQAELSIIPHLISFDNKFDNIYVINELGEIQKINDSLSFISAGDAGDIYPGAQPVVMDVDNDSYEELIVKQVNGKEFRIYRNDFSDPVTISFNYIPETFNFSVKTEKNGPGYFVIDTNEELDFYEYGLSFYHKFWYLVFLASLFLSGSVILISDKIIEFREIKRLNNQNQMAELQMKSVINQIDPHFTFNLLESFGSLINEHDSERAEYILGKYSGMLKKSVLNSDKIIISLKEEIDFIRSYLDLERFRYRNRFDYRIDVEEGIDTGIQMPKMMIHIFVENAIKHGLKHLNQNSGELVISVNRTGTVYRVIVRDNGVGRKRAAEIGSFSTGKGLGVVDKMIELNVSLHKKKIQYAIKDLYADNNPAGTEVTIDLPL